VLGSLVAERYPEVAEHQGRVERLAGSVARTIDFPEAEIPALLQAARLHDVGKLAIPETILAKPEGLSEPEWELMHQHTVIGQRILTAVGVLPLADSMVRSSHERIDGQGYPDGLIGEQIPLGARIICACDAYDAMRSSRPYRVVPMSEEAAIGRLEVAAGTQFDPAVVAALLVVISQERLAR
jgi:HD-GYP domain-containing protein (c-di-GMP phosphodiesterase class II)